MSKLNIFKMNAMKKEGIPVAWVTAYDYPMAYCAEKAGVDMILVGDSGGMVQYGYSNTNPIVMDEMIMMAKAVRRGAPNTFIIGDMPQGSYEISDEDAVRNALRFIKEAGCDAIKLEGGCRVSSRIEAIVNSGILVMGHLGLTPQSTQSFGGYKVQCKDLESFVETIDDASCLEKAGVFSILLEAIPTEPGWAITKKCKVPVYGVGAGSKVDGQLLIMHDLLGLYPTFRPYFSKCYIPDASKLYFQHINNHATNIIIYGRETKNDGLLFLITHAIEQYVKEVREGIFPTEEFCYPIKKEELDLLKESDLWPK
ncbi:MAG: 3-methyl-2-oxobutanoate hydroxymethyltransferase [Candidatus Omnitrophica bacterium]|jgi:3-methyl-2-oxobutanoate hydroxymethyltransferase|nr:3-methyl-2-oxobutanoate hydroxymethyltransferase [Candidatus Omnitrophota bacterium]